MLFIYIFKGFLIFMCIGILLAHASVYCMPAMPAESASPGTGVTESGELPCGYWEFNPGPLKSSQCCQLLSHLSSFCFFLHVASTTKTIECVEFSTGLRLGSQWCSDARLSLTAKGKQYTATCCPQVLESEMCTSNHIRSTKK